MNDSDDVMKKYIDSLDRLANRYFILARATVDFGTGEKLTASEIHSIEAVGNNKGITVSKLSVILGITKGAVSQMIGKLERKGYVSKARPTDSWKELELSLTVKGEKAFRGHVAFHRKMESAMLEEIEKYSSQEIESHLELMKKIEGQIDRYIARFG